MGGGGRRPVRPVSLGWRGVVSRSVAPYWHRLLGCTVTSVLVTVNTHVKLCQKEFIKVLLRVNNVILIQIILSHF